MENRSYKIGGIKNLLKRNYELETDIIDLDSIIDDNLSMRENWYIIIAKIKPLVKPNKRVYL